MTRTHMSAISCRRARWRGQGGFTYLGLLFLVTLMILATSAAALVWSLQKRRNDEEALLDVGSQIRKGIESYGRASGNISQPYPTSLVQMLEDRRGNVLRRHLRRVDVDPLTGALDWVLLRDAKGGIVGVASPSTRKPIKVSGFTAENAFEKTKTYRDWRFVVSGAIVASVVDLNGKAAEADPPLAASPDNTAVAEKQQDDPSANNNNAADGNFTPPPHNKIDNISTGLSCNTIAFNDQHTCQIQLQRFGQAAANECLTSAAERASACAAAGGRITDVSTLPPLISR